MGGPTSSGAEINRHFALTTLSSIIAGGVARLVCHPLDTIKAKIQVTLQK
jgi:hypothetical protein